FNRFFCFFFSSRRRHTRSKRDWSSDVCSSDLPGALAQNHQHIFCLRIDPAIDGHRNTVVCEQSLPMPMDLETNPFGNGYQVVSRSEERRVGKECRSLWSTYD